MPFELPEGWEWVRCGSIMVDSFYGPRFASSDYSTEGVPTIRTTDMTSDGHIALKDPPRVSVPEEKMDLYLLKSGDLLVTRSGSIGTMAIFYGAYPAIPSAYLIRFRFTQLLVEFVFRYLHSPVGQSLLGLGSNKTAQPNISGSSIAMIPFPLPPLNDQRRIVKKVDELTRLCKDLEEGIKRSEAKADKMLEAVVREALGPRARHSVESV